MNNRIIAIVVVLFAVLTPGHAEEKENSDPVFKSFGEAMEEVVAYVVKAQIADDGPENFSVGVFDYGAMPGGDELVSLPTEIRTKLAKRLPKLWKNYVELDQVEFVPRRRPGSTTPDEMLPKVTKDSKGNPISFLKITGFRYIDDRTIHVSWKCQGGGTGGNGGTKSLTKVGNEWKISEIKPYFFD